MEREEALHELRSFIGQLTEGCREALETIIPELKSDDERIRKWLIGYFKNVGNTWIHREISPEQILSYLEKQKDHFRIVTKMVGQKPAEESDVVPIRFEEGDGEKYPIVDYKLMEQKPAEWSEEDSINLNSILNHLKEYLTNDAYTYYENWLKFLPERFNPQLKQEWSEEDEKIIDTIVSVLGQYIDYKAVSGTGSGSAFATPRYSKEIDWLNSLRPPFKDREMKLKILKDLSTRCSSLEFEEVEDYLNNLRPSWKPSEEQPEVDLEKELEEEIERFYRTDEYRIADTLGRGFETLARHFAEWGARHSINWGDVQLLDTFILELSREEKDGTDWGDSEKFYTEVLRRFHEFNDKKISEIVAEWGAEHARKEDK